MKQIFIFYIKADEDINFSPTFKTYNKRNLLTEKKNEKNFYNICFKKIENFKKQAPRTFKNSYFIFLPSRESFLREIIIYDNLKEYVFFHMEHLGCNKLFENNFMNFLKKINDEDFFENVELFSDNSFEHQEEISAFYKYEILKK
jgi:hypothetical protein